jgi:hypothetical protein
MESDSAVRISDDTKTVVYLSEGERSFPLEIFPVVCGANLDPNLTYTAAEASCLSLTSIQYHDKQFMELTFHSPLRLHGVVVN